MLTATIISSFHFISAVHIWFISYIINTHFFHGNIWTHNWPAPNVSGFIAQLVEHRTGNREVTGSNPVEVLNFFQASLRNCINCVNCDNHFFISYNFLLKTFRYWFISMYMLQVKIKFRLNLFNLQSWTKVLGTALHYSYFSLISRFPLKTVHPCWNFLTVLPLPTLYKVETWKKTWIQGSNIVCGVRGGVMDLCELENALEIMQKCPTTFVHDCRLILNLLLFRFSPNVK